MRRRNNKRGKITNENLIDKEQEVEQLNNPLNELLFVDNYKFIDKHEDYTNVVSTRW